MRSSAATMLQRAPGQPGAPQALDDEPEAGGVAHVDLPEVQQHGRRAGRDEPVQRHPQVRDGADVEPPAQCQWHPWSSWCSVMVTMASP